MGEAIGRGRPSCQQQQRGSSRRGILSRYCRFYLYCWVLLLLCRLPTNTEAILCDTLEENTWDALTLAMEASQGFLMLCPFEIRGDGCRTEPGLGYVVPHDTSLTVLCEQDVFGAKLGAAEGGQQVVPPACVVDCPGNHFTISSNATLTLDGMTVRGSGTSSSIYLQSTAQFQAFDSTFENNTNPSGNGGAIHAGESAKLVVKHCRFQNNSALNGGAIYSEGESRVKGSVFIDNLSTSTSAMAGGGAMAMGVFAKTTVVDCHFEKNEAMNTLGAAILDHSTDINATISSANTGCHNRAQTPYSTLLSCNGIERSRPATGEAACLNFEESCVSTSRETGTPTPSQSPFPYVSASVILPTPEDASFEPTAYPSKATEASENSPTSYPDADPCLEDPDSFECVLQTLLDEESP